MKNHFKLSAITLLASTLLFTPSVYAEELEEIVVTGIRTALESALQEKRFSDNLVEIIQAEDIGKLPDQNLAEVLENITGIQITRQAGVGTNVQIRGTDQNRVEINGVSTVSAGSGRNGIDFEDVNAAIISSVEVTKSPEAKTIEGSVGGTVNLRTIRPLELDDRLLSIRLQGEDSSLSTEGTQPRVSGAFGNNWSTGNGDFGFVISASYTDLGIQFLVQEQENDDYETTNLATTFEWAPRDNLKFHFDAIINDQERSRDQYRLQASGVSSLRQISIPTAFETVDFGVGQNPTFPAALQGFLEPDLANDDDDPNLRFSSETNSRVTDNSVFAIGADWQGEKWSASVELSTSESDTETPNLSTTLNFINPNCPLDASSNDNCVPFVYDLSGGSLSWGVNFDSSPFSPAPADLLNPANVVLDQVAVDRNTNENSENAFRLDASYDLQCYGITTLDFGLRLKETSSEFNDIGDRIGGFSQLVDSPNGTLFAELLVPGPTNFNSADGRDLFVRDFLLLDPDRSFSDPDGVIAILQNAVIQHDPASPDILNLQPDQNAFYEINEDSTALYAQANFAHGIFRGNVGLRYVDAEIDSIGFGPADASGNRSLQTTSGSYDFLLPRINVVADVREDLIIRAGYTNDVLFPSFNQLRSGFSFDTSENASVGLGNPGLEPEEFDSFDIALEWYFADAAVASIGYFRKERSNIFGQAFEGAAILPSTTTTGGFERETDPSCPGGGIFNPDLGDVSIPRGLLDFSENAYNITLFYEKFGLSARARYTWREGFRTNDFAGGANTSGSSTFSFPVHTLDRGQLNASINYDVTENFNVGVEAVNLTEERIDQHCVSETGPLCFVGFPDRRIVFGASYTF